MTEYEERALQIIDRLRDENKINNREMGCLRRAILENRNKGEWFMTRAGFAKCPYCKCEREIPENFCGYCGAEMQN